MSVPTKCRICVACQSCVECQTCVSCQGACETCQSCVECEVNYTPSSTLQPAPQSELRTTSREDRLVQLVLQLQQIVNTLAHMVVNRDQQRIQQPVLPPIEEEFKPAQRRRQIEL